MTKQTNNAKPETIADVDLDQATGGIAMLLPAVQAAREAESSTAVPAEDFSFGYEQIKHDYKKQT